MILFKDEYELAMGGPLMGQASVLLENRVLVKLDGIFSEQVLWQTNGKYVALAKWSKEEKRYVNHKICIIDLQNLQIGEFEEAIFVKRFSQFKDDVIECEYYEKQRVKFFVGNLKNLTFKSLRSKNAA
jgi:hypothetical protein